LFDSELATCHPLETLNHAFKHGYPELCDKAALNAISLPRSKSLEALVDPDLRLRWVSIQTTAEVYYIFLIFVLASLQKSLGSLGRIYSPRVPHKNARRF